MFGRCCSMWIALSLVVSLNDAAQAQLAPEIGYVYPAGGQVGTTTDVILGGYDWTPDMQLFVHDPRIKLEIVGPPSPVLISEPPYWFGYKARGFAWPLAREFKAKLTIPADVSPGLVKWQVANANGESPVGTSASFQKCLRTRSENRLRLSPRCRSRCRGRFAASKRSTAINSASRRPDR